MSESDLMLNAIGGLVIFCLWIGTYIEVRATSIHTRRQAEATERIAAWVDWWGKRNSD